MKNRNILFETDKLLIFHEFEDAYLIDKARNQLLKDDFYGDPQCALISENNDWALIGGEHLTIWKNGVVKKFNNENIKDVHSLRQKNKNIIELLIDPWSEKSAIWELKLSDLSFNKKMNFTKYRDKEYTENIIW